MRSSAILFAMFVFSSGASAEDYTLAFASFAPLNADIFIAEADGSNAEPLAPHDALDYNARFTEDGQWVLFTSDRAGSADIYRVRPDGSSLERLTDDPAYDDQAALSRDGRLLAFVSTRSGNADIFVLELPTGELRNVTNHPGGDFRPAWSNDGQFLAFSSDRDSARPRAALHEGYSTEIYLMRADGSNVRRLSYYDGAAGTPAWAPEDQSIAFYAAEARDIARPGARTESSSTTQIIEFEVESGVSISRTFAGGAKAFPQYRSGELAYYDGSGQGALRFGDGGSSPPGEYQAPDFSPDGTRVVFHRETGREWPPLQGVPSPDPQFSLVRTGTFPRYSPDGRRITMNDSADGLARNGILLVSADGSSREPLLDDPEHSAIGPAWSSDGTRIAFGLGRFFPLGDGSGPARLALLDVTSRAVTVLTGDDANAELPSWSPDGTRIVFRKATDSAASLHVLDVETRTDNPLLQDFGSVSSPAWSPDGNLILFTSDHGGDDDLYTIDLVSRHIERLTNTPGSDGHGAWSPNGEWIAFASMRGGYKDEAALNLGRWRAAGDVYVMRPDGSDVRMLTENPYEEATPGWAPPAARSATPPPASSRFKLRRRER
jgi:Tol biopolymer transport system component